MNEYINMRECRGLTLAGRILIFKSLALSKVLYICALEDLMKNLFGVGEDSKSNIQLLLEIMLMGVTKM